MSIAQNISQCRKVVSEFRVATFGKRIYDEVYVRALPSLHHIALQSTLIDMETRMAEGD